MQEPSDTRGVIVQRNTIVEAFKARGYTPNMDTGAEYKPNSKNSAWRYLIGQGLAGLRDLAIHGIIHTFADEWKRKFAGHGKLH